MTLSDRCYRALLDSGALRISPHPTDRQLQPASIDLRLGGLFIYPDRKGERAEIVPGEPFVINPGEFVLATTMERVTIPPDLLGVACGKSSIARQGLQVGSAGFIDPGFDGAITLELLSMRQQPLTFTVGQRICQLQLSRISSPALRPYGHADLGSHYQGQETTEGNRMRNAWEGW